jgi:phosphoglycolate/pyridoxal phosphate phosphatase family enzyme
MDPDQDRAAVSRAPGAARDPGGSELDRGPVRLVAVDLDGVVWLGGTIIPNAVEALTTVVERGFDLRYVTNNSTAHREAVSERLAAAGLPAGGERVFTSGYVTGRWLRRRLPEGAPVLVVGEAGLMRELSEAGLAPVRAGGGPEASGPAGPAPAPGGATVPNAAGGTAPVPAAPFQAVVVGMDRGFNYSSLAQAQAAILAGALFVGTNPDATFPTPGGLLPGAGSVVAAVATAAQKEPVFMGKPGLGLAEVLAALTGVPAGQTLFIGDRMSTDIGMGRRAGMITALVLTGVTSPADLEHARAEGSADLPDHVLVTLAGLPALLEALTAQTRGRRAPALGPGQ